MAVETSNPAEASKVPTELFIQVFFLLQHAIIKFFFGAPYFDPRHLLPCANPENLISRPKKSFPPAAISFQSLIFQNFDPCPTGNFDARDAQQAFFQVLQLLKINPVFVNITAFHNQFVFDATSYKLSSSFLMRQL